MSTTLFDAPDVAAVLSPCGSYRYTLRRSWADGQCVAFLMFNPSTADATQDDATIRKCRGFAQRWGYARMVIVNLFAIRGRDPKVVTRAVDPVGPMCDWHIIRALDDAREVICAWGQPIQLKGKLAERPQFVLAAIRREYEYMPVQCLGRTDSGNPRHPLMLAYATEREPFSPEPLSAPQAEKRTK